jgi:hypothetical protein
VVVGRTLRLVLSVLALLSLLSSGGSRENAAISSLGASLVVVVVFWCYGFWHQAWALLMFVISVVASGIKLGRCCLLMEVLCAVASGIMNFGSFRIGDGVVVVIFC